MVVRGDDKKSDSLCLLLGIGLALMQDALSPQSCSPLVVRSNIVPVRQEDVLCSSQLLQAILQYSANH